MAEPTSVSMKTRFFRFLSFFMEVAINNPKTTAVGIASLLGIFFPHQQMAIQSAALALIGVLAHDAK